MNPIQFLRTLVARLKDLPATLSGVGDRRGGWWPLVREGFPGAWQRNIEIATEDVLTYAAVFACVTLIASDIAKLRVKLVLEDTNGIWNETENPAYSPVLRKPNHFQTRIQFFEQWMNSKLVHGNTYVLKQRDDRGGEHRGNVVALYVLDAPRVRPMVGPDGAIYYSLNQDNLTKGRLQAGDIVPASEIIHDRWNTLYHPLVGLSPISACGLAAIQGLRVQEQSVDFFANSSMPGGILTSVGDLKPADVKDIKEQWESEFTGRNAGRVAVLSGGFEYKPMIISAKDAQLIEQLKWTAQNVCTAFKVPPYMIGVGPPPSHDNVEALNGLYYGQTLQNPIESIELLLDEGLGTKKGLGTEFDLDDLMRMDTPRRVKAAADAVGSGTMSPNEGRKRYHGLGPVAGGDTPYLQQQNYSLSALAKRDAREDPFASKTTPKPTSSTEPEPVGDGAQDKSAAKAQLQREIRVRLKHAA